MPVYEYECSSCNKQYEIWQKITDEPKKDCPECSGPLHKLISVSSFQLKGSGWYSDGYSSVKNKEISKTDKEAVISKAKANKNKQQTASSSQR